MMFHPRKILIGLGILLVVFGGWQAWRASHPPLSDEQQIAANIDAIREAIQNRNARNLRSYLADDFSWNGMSRSEVNNQLVGLFIQSRDVTANVTGLKISLNGESATTTGKYSIAYRPTPRAPADAYIGNFKLSWQKRDGQWLITKAEGGQSSPQ